MTKRARKKCRELHYTVGTNGSSTEFKIYTVPGNTQYYTVILFQIKNKIYPCPVVLPYVSTRRYLVIFCTNTTLADVKINTHCACTHRKVFILLHVCVHLRATHIYRVHTCTHTCAHTSLFAFQSTPFVMSPY